MPRVLPDIDLYIEEFTELQHNKLNGIYKGGGGGGGGGVMTAAAAAAAAECDAGSDSLQSLDIALKDNATNLSHSTHTTKTNLSTGTTHTMTMTMTTSTPIYFPDLI